MSTDELVPITFPRLGPASGQAVDDVAFARGHAAGYTFGLSLAASELAERKIAVEAEVDAARTRADTLVRRRLQMLDAAAHALEVRSAPVLAEARGRILDVAFGIAEALVGHALEDGPSSARAAVLRALHGAEGQEVRAVHLHPADLALLDPEDTVRPGLVLVPDTALQQGDAWAELPDGTVDARLGTALERVRAVLGNVDLSEGAS